MIAAIIDLHVIDIPNQDSFQLGYKILDEISPILVSFEIKDCSPV